MLNPVHFRSFKEPEVVEDIRRIVEDADQFAAGNVNKWLVGWGMVPRGEVGLIFAAMSKSLGIISNEMFSVIVIVVILSTLITPPILTVWLKKV